MILNENTMETKNNQIKIFNIDVKQCVFFMEYNESDSIETIKNFICSNISNVGLTVDDITIFKIKPNMLYNTFNKEIIVDEHLDLSYDYYFRIKNKIKTMQFFKLRAGYNPDETFLPNTYKISNAEYYFNIFESEDFIKITNNVEGKGKFMKINTQTGEEIGKIIIFGTIKTESGTLFDGYFEKGILKIGSIIWNFGQVDVGEFEDINNIPVISKGTKTCNFDGNETVYCGKFTNGILNLGKIIWTFGQTDEGEFINIDGFPVLYKGKSSCGNGVTYEGTFDSLDGCYPVIQTGKITFNCGTIHEGHFKYTNGIAVIYEGKIIFPDGIISEGYFELEGDTIFLTEGTKTFPDGEIRKIKNKKNV